MGTGGVFSQGVGGDRFAGAAAGMGNACEPRAALLQPRILQPLPEDALRFTDTRLSLPPPSPR